MVKKKVKPTRYIGTVFVLGSILLVGTIYFFNRSQAQDTRTKAENPDPNFCQDKCVGQDRCGNGPPGDIYNAPCCDEIKRTGDPFACGWPDRGYCRDDQCASIPEGVDRQRCGGPRHSWCNLCIENNCTGYGSTPLPTKIPPTHVPPSPTIYIPPPTITPNPTIIIPTTIRTVTPTTIPTQWILPSIVSSPTVYFPPTDVPANYSTPYISPAVSPPTLTPAPTPRKIALPQILPPKEKVQSFWESLKVQVISFFEKYLP